MAHKFTARVAADSQTFGCEWIGKQMTDRCEMLEAV
jgi:hypothetical protein